MVEVLKDGKIAEAKELDESSLKVLNSSTRIEILKLLSEKPTYPAKIAKELDSSKQKIYYHFEKLEEADLIEEESRQEKSGGQAVLYKPTEKVMVLDLEFEGENFPVPDHDKQVSKFLRPLVEDSELNGRIVVGSPDQHGPDQVRARDGHIATELAFKLGNYSRKEDISTCLDTEIVREEEFDTNILMLGGVLTNVVSKKFNQDFPVRFETENFPYQEIRTPDNSYTEESIGFIAKTSNPKDHSKSIFIVAGVRSKGTKAAVRAFNDLENVVSGYSAGRFYAVVRGLDLNSDGEIDDYKVIETSE